MRSSLNLSLISSPSDSTNMSQQSEEAIIMQLGAQVLQKTIIATVSLVGLLSVGDSFLIGQVFYFKRLLSDIMTLMTERRGKPRITVRRVNRLLVVSRGGLYRPKITLKRYRRSKEESAVVGARRVHRKFGERSCGLSPSRLMRSG